MRVRSALLSIALACTSAPLLPLLAQGVEYAPGTTRYHVTTATRGTQSSPMGSQAFDIGVDQRLTVTLVRQSKDTMLATLTIDSIGLHSDGPMPDVTKYNGTKLTALMSPTGKVYSTKGPDASDPLLAQLAEGLGRFLPVYRRDLHSGLAWSDTTSGKVTQQGILVDRTIVADYAVLGDTMAGGEKGFKVRRHSAMKAAGSGTPMGNAVSIASSTTDDATFVVSAAGTYLGGDSNDDIDLKLTIAAQGATVAVKQNAVQAVRVIR